MKVFSFSSALLLMTVSLFAANEAPARQIHQPQVLAQKDSSYTVTVTVVADGTGSIVTGARVTTSRHHEATTNASGVSTPVEINEGDTITISAEGYSKRSFLFSPVVEEYQISDGQRTVSKKIHITISLTNY